MTAPTSSPAPHVCHICSSAYPDLMDLFQESGCAEEWGEHTPEAIVLATVLAAAVNGANTNDLFIQAFLDDALALIHYLGHAPNWQVEQDREDPDRWSINGIAFVLDYGATGEGPGDLTPVVPDRTCSFCEESVGWRALQIDDAVEIECKGCGDLMKIERWWTKHEPAGGASS